MNKVMHATTKVVFIRETGGQMTGSNCCGKLEGDNARQGDGFVFAERRGTIARMAPLYKMIKEEYTATVELEVVDPRNQLYLVPRLVRDIFRYKVGFFEGLKTIFSFSVPSIIINGRLAFAEDLPEPEILRERLDSLN